jgi:hypothetical protein
MAKKRNKEELGNVNITLTAKELTLLVDEPPELMKLYILLNHRRDFGTNIAGKATRISDSTFKEWMDYPKKQGKQGWKPSTTHIVRWLDQLAFLGLIKPLGNYVFELPLAFVSESMQNKCHQTVTKTVTKTVTNSEVDETPIKIDKNNNIEIEVSPEVSPEVSKKLYIPLDNRLDKIRLDAPAKKFRQLLIDRGFYLNHMTNTKTLAMIKLWVDSNVTVEEAEIAMNHADAQLGKRADHPSYYRNIPFQYRKELQEAKSKVEEIKHEKVQRNNRQAPARRSKTEMFYSECFDGIEKYLSSED